MAVRVTGVSDHPKEATALSTSGWTSKMRSSEVRLRISRTNGFAEQILSAPCFIFTRVWICVSTPSSKLDNVSTLEQSTTTPVTPHVSGWHLESAVTDVVENYKRLIAGEPLMNEVDRAAGY